MYILDENRNRNGQEFLALFAFDVEKREHCIRIRCVEEEEEGEEGRNLAFMTWR